MLKVAFYTLGCKVNQYETNALIALFEKENYEVVEFSLRADIYIINTCTVTNLSDRKSRQMIRRAKKLNNDSVIVVTGCYAQVSKDEILQMPEVDIVTGTKEKLRILNIVKEFLSLKKNQTESKICFVEDILYHDKFDDLQVTDFSERTRAHVKIQDGCNQFCSYCIIPFARGPIRSKPLDDVIKEIGQITKKGYKEIVLTGIHTTSYGKDLGINLMDLIKEVHEFKGIERIRLSSIEPNIITQEFITFLTGHPKVCKHFHISLQSGCNNTLKDMNRKYDTYRFQRGVDLIRKNFIDAAITTDIMVGFPGESDEDFLESYNFCKKQFFSSMHVFKYSPRKGTQAYSRKDQVEEGKKEKRSKMMIELSSRMQKSFNSNFIGKTMDVLLEDFVENDNEFLTGYTDNYIRVLVKANLNLKGKIVKVKIQKAKEEYLAGKLLLV